MRLILKTFQKLMKQRKKITFISFITVVTLCGTYIISIGISYNNKLIRKINNFGYYDISCHYRYENDSLPLARLFRPLLKSIFFHETSCRGHLNSRQACSVESTARSNPNWNIYVLFSGPVTKDSLSLPAMKALQAISNVKFFRINITDYAKGSPVESLVVDGILNSSWYPISHTSDVLRFLTLYKWGGVYMDLDVIVVKSFDTLESNWASRGDNQTIAAGAMAFSRDKVGRRIAEAALRDLQFNFLYYDWGNNGPGVITRVLENWFCDKIDLDQWNRYTCQGFEIYGPDHFYPIKWADHVNPFYYNDEEQKGNLPYSYHFWNKVTYDINMTEDCFYVKLAKKYCPSVYQAFGASFGFYEPNKSP